MAEAKSQKRISNRAGLKFKRCRKAEKRKQILTCVEVLFCVSKIILFCDRNNNALERRLRKLAKFEHSLRELQALQFGDLIIIVKENVHDNSIYVYS
ncbi:hypothetical protein JTE90_012029 [Oedothorax gibbosus]|uniref:MADS-box domain-containing protein n=1 Tax=Oedothorax gibbosus TaxID=931172 RepID=A0AAV6UBT5_9ARAC|nr:hypothetical protein JTE90_012029 [Oedothorax gibbosus]